jgi:transcriptional regulator with XRE-family HTH domain
MVAFPVRQAPPADLGPLLRSARERRGWSLREAARRVRISHTYLIDLEAGRRAPSVAVAEDLREQFGLTDDEAAILDAAAVESRGRSHPLRITGTVA